MELEEMDIEEFQEQSPEKQKELILNYLEEKDSLEIGEMRKIHEDLILEKTEEGLTVYQYHL